VADHLIRIKFYLQVSAILDVDGLDFMLREIGPRGRMGT
jgi:hypothetical protein